MFTLQYAKNPIYSSEDGKSIDLVVKWVEFNGEIPFAATHNDPMPHGVDLYNRALAGEFGEIAEYVPPPISGNVATNQPTTTGSQDL